MNPVHKWSTNTPRLPVLLERVPQPVGWCHYKSLVSCRGQALNAEKLFMFVNCYFSLFLLSLCSLAIPPPFNTLTLGKLLASCFSKKMKTIKHKQLSIYYILKPTLYSFLSFSGKGMFPVQFKFNPFSQTFFSIVPSKRLLHLSCSFSFSLSLPCHLWLHKYFHVLFSRT